MPDARNLLFLIVDDLRPELACFGRPHVSSPNLDALAARSLSLQRCYCQVPVCGASRASLLTGTPPGPERFVTFHAKAEEEAPQAVPLHAHLVANGYAAESYGKVFHHGKDHADAWTAPPWHAANNFPGYRDPENIALFERMQAANPGKKLGIKRGPPWERYDGPDSDYGDAQVADRVIDALDRLGGAEQPFMLAGGFTRPHLPFNAPAPYWDRYDRDAIPLPDLTLPDDVPEDLLHNCGELVSNYTEAGGDIRDPEFARTMIHGYLAATSFLDAQVGRILDALASSPRAGDTAIVFCVDHGWNLGEHGLWCKHSLYETSLRVPLMIHVPGRSAAISRSVVANQDIYPTVLEVLGMEPPASPVHGRSLLPLFDDPGSAIHDAVVSRYFHGESVRTQRWRYSEWQRDGAVIGRALFDHDADPGELRNVAEHPANAAVVAELSAKLPWGTERPE